MVWGNWRNQKYWLTGGIIGFTILLLVIIINATNSGAMTPFYLIFSNIKRVLITPMDNLFTSDEIGLNILVYSFAFYFIMGALIGFIYGKIKSRNKSTTAKLPHN